MSGTYLYYKPFARTPIIIDQQKFDEICAAAESIPTQKSLDGVDLRKKVVGSALGFLHVRIYSEEAVDFDYDADEIALHLARSDVSGVRGSRAVIVPQDWDEHEITSVWVGRNVWYNKHRLTSGFPSSNTQIDDFIYDVEMRSELSVEIADRKESFGKERAIVDELSAALGEWEALGSYAEGPEKDDLKGLIGELIEKLYDTHSNRED